jgi:hypothetical protein
VPRIQKLTSVIVCMRLGGEEALGPSCALHRAGKGTAQESAKALPQRIRHCCNERKRLEAPRSSNREEEEDDVHLCCGEVDHPFVVPAAELGELILPSL